MEPTTSDRQRAAPPTIAGVASLVVGLLALLAGIVGYSLTNGSQTAGDRLADAEAFGLPAGAVAGVGLVLVILGLVLLGVGVGAARTHHGDEHPHPLH